MTRFRVPLEKLDSEQSSVGFGAQVSGLAATAVFLLLVGAAAWMAQGVNAAGLAAKVNVHGVPGAKSDAQALLRARFLKAIDASLRAAGVDSSIDEGNGTLRLGPASVAFKVGQAWLVGKPLEHVDIVGAVLSKAAACLPKPSQGYAAPSVLDARPGLQACTAPETLAAVAFTCAPEFSKLKLDAVLVEGHADARAYAVPGRQFKDNLNLSSARGETVLRRLHACTPSVASAANAQGQPLVSLGAHSTQRPAVANDPEGEANRRVEFRFVLDTRTSASAGKAPAKSPSEAPAAAPAEAPLEEDGDLSLPAAEGEDAGAALEAEELVEVEE